MRSPMKLFFLLGFVGFLSSLGYTQNLEEFEKKLTEFTLDNGLKFIVVERHEAPVIAFHTHANVGSVDEKKGITGISHLFEHMAFKGTKTIGTINYDAEVKLFDKMDSLFSQLKLEKRKGRNADQSKIDAWQAELDTLKDEAQHYSFAEFDQAVNAEGGENLNAGTSWDYTVYHFSLPSNKLELWFSLESDRFLNPVLREFYKERDVVAEERRLRTENNPFGLLWEEFRSTAFKAHPYAEPIIGHMSDIQTITREEAMQWFTTYYGPGNLTISIVGDVDPNQVKELAEIYFGRLPKTPKPEPVETVEPEQKGERRCQVEIPAQPMLVVGYHTVDITHPDHIVLNTISAILGRGRSSRLNTKLVKELQIASYVQNYLFYSKYPDLFTILLTPAPGKTVAENEQALYAEIERLKTEKVSEEELEKARTSERAFLVRQLGSNEGLAEQLASYEVLTGDWRNLFRDIDRMNNVSAEDVQRVAQTYFLHTNRTVGELITKK
jgi:predicted Zn-dependent peptidase